jgi:uncharacterized protein (TIGR03437 family)
MLFRCFVPLLALIGSAAAFSQTIMTCNTTGVPVVVRAEGITERVGDININCFNGPAGATITGNLTVSLNVNVTNRVGSGNAVAGLLFTSDNGTGPQPLTTPATIQAPSEIAFNGLTFTLSPAGSASLKLQGVRGAANQVTQPLNNNILAFLTFNSQTLISFTTTDFVVAKTQTGLYAGFSDKIVCPPQGSPLPGNLNSFVSFLGSGSIFATTRVTEGFADSFGAKSAFANFNADNGERFLITYSGLPAGASLYVPDVVAGSDALQPTAGGDLGVPPSGGQYQPGSGTLLLARVPNANANGAGGAPVYTPSGSNPVSFDSVNPVALTNGTGTVTYEVVDSSSSTLETAQFPTFLGLAPSPGGATTQTDETVSFAAVSTVMTATASDPIPRFIAIPAPSDCGILGDCNASYFPKLGVSATSLSYTATQGTDYQVQYVEIHNQGGGLLYWTASAAYQNASGWLRLEETNGVNNSTLRIDALPNGLSPGTYQATVSIDGGPVAGTQTIAVTFVVTPASAVAPSPAISGVVNGASFTAGPIAPGSIATLFGTMLAGKNVAVTFDGNPATVFFGDNTQINVLAPASLQGKASTQAAVTVDGIATPAMTVALAPFAPGIFPGAVLNQDYSVNAANNPAAAGSIIQIFGTGLSGNGAITAVIGGITVSEPYYAGPAPGLAGVQQVDLVVPSGLTGALDLAVCGASTGQSPACSPAVKVQVQ